MSKASEVLFCGIWNFTRLFNRHGGDKIMTENSILGNLLIQLSIKRWSMALTNPLNKNKQTKKRYQHTTITCQLILFPTLLSASVVLGKAWLGLGTFVRVRDHHLGKNVLSLVVTVIPHDYSYKGYSSLLELKLNVDSKTGNGSPSWQIPTLLTSSSTPTCTCRLLRK